jgi:hypothetical protein
MKAIAIALLLAGCLGNWVKPGGTNEQFQRDMYDCKRDSAAVEDVFRRISMEDQCMRSKGWNR